MPARQRNSSLRTCRTLEQLESRQMMAGDIRAQLVAGTLFLTESGGTAPQAVQVSQMFDGRILVAGEAAAGGGVTKINGQTAAVFGVASPFAPRLNLNVSLGGGEDSVTVRDAKFKDVTILTADTFGQGANDADVVRLENVKTSGAVNIATGAGNDTVAVFGATIGDTTGADNLTIRSGLAGVPNNTDLDAVFIQRAAVFGSTTVETGAGADFVSIQKSNFGDATNDFVLVDAGGGADTVELGTTKSLGIVTGPVQATGTLTVLGDSFANSDAESGDDLVRMQDVFSSLDIAVNLRTGNDRLEMTNLNARFVALHGEKGNDTMQLTEVYALETVFALMGEGDDTLDMIAVRAHRIEADGGAGANDKLLTYDMTNAPLFRSNFEFVNGKPVLSKTLSTDLGGLSSVQLQQTR